MKSRIILLLIIIFQIQVNAQFLEDEKNKELTLKGLDFLYNQQFDQANDLLNSVKNAYPLHPVRYLLNAIQLQWEYIPIDKNPDALKKYTAELYKCISASKIIYKNPKYKKEATFFLLATHGFIALSYNYQKEYFEAASEAKKAHSYFNEGKKYKNENPEFLFASGLYNFYRVQYPESHPMAKPVMMFFEDGNKKLGLQELENSYKKSIFSRTEAALYLVSINIKYESNFKKALTYSTILNSKYPNNYIFKIKHIEALLLNSEFDDAAKLNESLKNRKDKVSQLSALVFEAYLDEQSGKNLQSAFINYAKALKIPPDDRYTKEYHGMAYLGMARIFVKQKETGKAKAFYKECLKIAEYDWVVNAAKAELKKIS
jgi:tetratricopeptide (TPR) repeat protein